MLTTRTRRASRRALAGAAALALLLTLRAGRPLGAADTPCGIEGVERIVAVGDVHGAYDRFVGILRASGVVDAQLRWSAGATHLVQLGDVVDRGPDSRQALDLLQRLQREATRAGGAVHVLLGNHEVMRLLGDLRFVAPGEYQRFVTADSEDVRRRCVQTAAAPEREQRLKETPIGFVEMRVAFGQDGSYGKWLRTLNAVVKIDGVLFVHGGISPAVAALSCDAINATVRRELTSEIDQTRAAPLSSLAAREDGPSWYRGLAQQPESFAPEIDGILSTLRARTIVVGHTLAPDGRIQMRFDGKVVQIDTGMQPAYVPAGRASALEILSGTFSAIYDDRRDILTGSRE